MPDWLSYGLTDFLLFSPRAYWRLCELLNLAWWPLPLLVPLLGAAGIALAILRPAKTGRWIAAALAVLWLWIAWAFLWRLYVPINWAAIYAIPLFLLQALALLWVAARRGAMAPACRAPLGMTGAALAVLAVLAYPLLSGLSGRGWESSEVFGLAPDPTVIATMGFALMLPQPWRRVLLVAPLLWCCVSALTHMALGDAEALVVAGAGLLGLIAAVQPRPHGGAERA